MFYILIVFVLVLHSFLDIAVFKSLEYRIKKEVKGIIKSGIPDEELRLFKFHKSITDEDIPGFEWEEENEFRYNNEMYDIVRQEEHNDSLYYYCFHDSEESELFDDFDKKIIDYLTGNNTGDKNLKTIINSINKYYNTGGEQFGFPLYPNDRILRAAGNAAIPAGFIQILIPPPKPVLPV